MRLHWTARVTSLLILAPATAALAEIPAIGTGPYAVGSSNMEVTSPLLTPMGDYLKGRMSDEGAIYVADILVHPESALVTRIEVPQDREHYGANAGASIPLALYVLYPTSAENPRESYTFPYPDTADNVFPAMQRAGETPIFANPGERYPLIVFSHGYDAHGVWDLIHLKFLAAHGYIVVSVFHGDGRIGFEPSVNIRPLQLKAALDFVLQHPDFGPAIDTDRIGVSGGSMGGYTVLAAMGGNYLKSAAPAADPRIKAGFGLVPFMGAKFGFGFYPLGMSVWPFGKDYSGLKSVNAPFLAVYCEDDASVPAKSVLAGTALMSGPASAVMLGGEKHLVSQAAWSDIYTWELLFFDAWLRGSAASRRQLYGADKSVAGGVDDQRTYLRPKLPQGAE